MRIGRPDRWRPRAAQAAIVAAFVSFAGMGAVARAGGEGSSRAQQPAAVLAVGDALPPLALKDQHGEPAAIGPATRVVLLSRDMDGGGHVKEALADGGRELLASRGAVYVADVSRMPGFVRSAFALPSMRRRPYPVALDETGAATAMLPSEEGKATVLVLEGGRIASIAFAGSSADVRGALQ